MWVVRKALTIITVTGSCIVQAAELFRVCGHDGTAALSSGGSSLRNAGRDILLAAIEIEQNECWEAAVTNGLSPASGELKSAAAALSVSRAGVDLAACADSLGKGTGPEPEATLCQ